MTGTGRTLKGQKNSGGKKSAAPKREKPRHEGLSLVTASDKETIVSCIQAGCNEYVVKPFDKATVAKKLAKLGFQVHLF